MLWLIIAFVVVLDAVLLRQKIGFVSASYMDRCFRHESGLDIVLSAKFGGFGRRLAITDKSPCAYIAPFFKSIALV